MFTGIVEAMGTVNSADKVGDGFELSIECSKVLEDAKLGDSIAVNGVCLTVTNINANSFTTGLAPETLNRTNLGTLQPGDKVNLERSALPTTRLGGHYVQGHVDTTGKIISFSPDNDALWVTIELPESVMRYIVSKGYITIDGTSLTIVDVGDNWFNITLVAFTQQHIILPTKAIGDLVNIEVDVLGKYVERLLEYRSTTPQQLTGQSDA